MRRPSLRPVSEAPPWTRCSARRTLLRDARGRREKRRDQSGLCRMQGSQGVESVDAVPPIIDPSTGNRVPDRALFRRLEEDQAEGLGVLALRLNSRLAE